MTTPDLLAAIRSLWNHLTPAEQQDLYDAVASLRRDTALAQAAQYQDPMCRFFAQQLAPAEAALPSPSSPQLSPPSIDI